MEDIQSLLDFGILIVDKPAGMTSFQTVDKLRKLLGVSKAGHTGTLDVQVTGVLPMLLGRATRLSDYFMHKDKEYVGEMYLHARVDRERLERIMREFVGEIIQKPPRKSRVKRIERPRMVSVFEIISVEGQRIRFHAVVQAGTYIRKLISDLGEKLGCGAHMVGLRRLKASIFSESEMHSMQDIEKAVSLWRSGNASVLGNMIVPGSVVSKIVPHISVNAEIAARVRDGGLVFDNEVANDMRDEMLVSVFCGDEFVAVMEKGEEGWRSKFVLR